MLPKLFIVLCYWELTVVGFIYFKDGVVLNLWDQQCFLCLPSCLWDVPTMRDHVLAELKSPAFLVLIAEALLEQAMIGPSPNPLILSYLKYAISSQVTTSVALLLFKVHYRH